MLTRQWSVRAACLVLPWCTLCYLIKCLKILSSFCNMTWKTSFIIKISAINKKLLKFIVCNNFIIKSKLQPNIPQNFQDTSIHKSQIAGKHGQISQYPVMLGFKIITYLISFLLYVPSVEGVWFHGDKVSIFWKINLF